MKKKALVGYCAVILFGYCGCSHFEPDLQPVTSPAIDGHILASGRVTWVDVDDSNIMAVDLNSGQKPYIAFHGGVDEMSWPLITTNGTWILFGTNGLIKAVQWGDLAGTSIRTVQKGYCPAATWRDPQTSTEWIYYLKFTNDSQNIMALSRFMLAKPSIQEIVWNRTPADYPFSLSQDGTYGAGQFPWPDCGLTKMEYSSAPDDPRQVVPNGAFFKAGFMGCNSNVFPDTT